MPSVVPGHVNGQPATAPADPTANPALYGEIPPYEDEDDDYVPSRTQNEDDDEEGVADDGEGADDDEYMEGMVQDAPMASCPPYRPQNIHYIVESVERYNPQNIDTLEQYVMEQLQSAQYDRDACLAVLKLYQFNPMITNIKVIANILTLALGALPDPDFNLCLCLLNEEVVEDPAIKVLIDLQKLLEECKFRDFWVQLDEYEEKKDSLPESEAIGEPAIDVINEYRAFPEMVRHFIAQTLMIAYQTVTLDQLAEYVHLSGERLSDWIDEMGWTFDDEDTKLVHMPITKDNQPKPVIVQEDIKYDQLTKIIGYGRLTV